MAAHPIEPELLRTPPRRIKRRGTRGLGMLWSQYAVLPIMPVLLWMPLACAHMILVRTSGPIIPSHIVNRVSCQGSKGGLLYFLEYQATFDANTATSQTLTDREKVDAASFARTPVGSTVPLQLSPLFPRSESVLLVPGRNIWIDVWILAVGSLFSVGFGGLVLWFIYLEPARRRKLVVRGVPVVGRITEKTQAEGKSNVVYYLHYQYHPTRPNVVPLDTSTSQPKGTMATLKAKQTVEREDWDAATIGERTTILYNPRRPKSSVLYRYGDYIALD